jgi:hypothetical protein
MELLIVAANIVTGWSYFGCRDLLASIYLSLYEGRVLGFVSHVSVICGDCFIPRFSSFLHSLEDYG